ncbi:MAG: transketolase [Clostridiales bacterium]|nr:transketolase [Clostridiales bacterium]
MNMTNDELTISTIRVLSAEAIEKAKSGHPGICLGAAPAAYTLFSRVLKHNPKNPNFFDRDRFVLSAGHGSALLYSLLHIFGYGLSKEDLMRFRQHTSKTPGHPEYGVTAGVEVSTGPLGQGIANAVGFALAEKILADKFNESDLKLVDHYTYALCGDGCMMEGIENEAASLAGTLKLGKLIVIYDSNRITIDGSTDLAFTEDVGKRHEALGWQVLKVNDGENIDSIEAALKLAKDETEKPSLVIVNTTIGYGSPLAGTSKCHGAPLGADNVKQLRANLGYKAKPFEVVSQVTDHIASLAPTFNKYESEWNKIVKAYKTKYPEKYEEFQVWRKGEIDFEALDSIYDMPEKNEATRVSSQRILNKIAEQNPFVFGGSADLATSNMVVIANGGDLSATELGRNIHFGIREHAMGAIANGMYLHGGLLPFCATFTVFSDYMKAAIRMSALMNIPVVYIFSHDSIGVGEDGPTHQPVEQLAMLRTIPNIKVFRPADSKETAAAYESAWTGKTPTVIVLSRQSLPQLDCTGTDALYGGYIVADSEKETPDTILISNGSELSLALAAKKQLKKEGIDARVVSMPCMELFDIQTQKYRESVLPSKVRARVAIEAGRSTCWYKYVGIDGECCCIDTFGMSAPADVMFEICGFNVDNVVKLAKKTVKTCTKSAEVIPTGGSDDE